MKKTTTLLILLTITTLTTIFAVTLNANTLNTTVPTQTTIDSSIGVYFDSSCNQKVRFIDWGNLIAGENITRTVYIRNASPEPMLLNMSTRNWAPEIAENQIGLIWNLENIIITPYTTHYATFTLSVSGTVTVTEFSMVINIKATQ
jgi:hypothetical protein